MIALISFLMRLAAIGILFGGAIVASQQHLGAAEVLVISAALWVIGDALKGIQYGINSKKESTLPGPNNVQK